VLRGGVGEQAGLSAGDELLALDGWRLRRLDDALRLVQPGKSKLMLVSRDQRVLELKLSLTKAAASATSELGSISLVVQAQPDQAVMALRKAWLAG
jgi:predicted metalloprotease with PDZ domain